MHHFIVAIFGLCLMGGLVASSRIDMTREESASEEKAVPATQLVPFVLKEFYKGVSWVGGRRSLDHRALAHAKKVGIEWISISPFGWMDNQYTPEVRLNRNARLWNESDNGVSTTARAAHESGIKVMLKPHIWLIRPVDNGWIGEITFDTEEKWQRWEKDYRRFILHYARVAETENIEILCIATELSTPVSYRPNFWKGLVKEIRQVYSGELTYAANWWRDYDQTNLWEDLDYIGVNAYFPLTDKINPSVDELMTGWRPHLQKIEELVQIYEKPVLFTEIGYKNIKGAAIKPWEWPGQVDSPRIDATEQVNAYEALFLTFGQREWFRGLFIWKWFSKVDRISSDRVAFSPQNKQAEEVLKKWYTFAGAK